MRAEGVRTLLHAMTKRHFADANVTFARQSRAAKPKLDLVVMAFGQVHRPIHGSPAVVDGEVAVAYESRMSLTVDIFTHGRPVVDEETGATIAYDNTAMDDALLFSGYLASPFITEWSSKNDVAILPDGDAQDLTGILNETSYEYRARLNLLVYFTQYAIGHDGTIPEEFIVYDENGDPILNPDHGKDTTGYFTSAEITDVSERLRPDEMEEKE